MKHRQLKWQLGALTSPVRKCQFVWFFFGIYLAQIWKFERLVKLVVTGAVTGEFLDSALVKTQEDIFFLSLCNYGNK